MFVSKSKYNTLLFGLQNTVMNIHHNSMLDEKAKINIYYELCLSYKLTIPANYHLAIFADRHTLALDLLYVTLNDYINSLY